MSEKKILELYKKGYTIREISDILNIKYHHVRNKLLRTGLHRPKSNFVTMKERKEWVTKYLSGESVENLSPDRSLVTVLKHLVEELKEIILEGGKL